MSTIKLLAGEVPLKKFLDNKDKYGRQLRSVVKWKQSGFKGSLEAATAFGKTFVARIALGKIEKRIKMTGKNFKVHVIVPRKVLKDQWEEEMSHFSKLSIEVFVINTYVKEPRSCDLIILDEMHLYASDTFSLWSKTNYRFILGLTATMKRLDGKEDFLLQKAPVFDKISQQECLERGWMSKLIEINCPVFLNKKEREEQNELNKKIASYFGFFGDYETIIECSSPKGASSYVARNKLALTSKDICIKANVARKLMRKRKEFIYNTEHKLRLARDLISKLNLRTITFSESVEFAENLKKSYPRSAIYHSNLETYTKKVKVQKHKFYKTMSGANKFISALKKKGIAFVRTPLNNGFKVEYLEWKVKKFSKATQQQMAVDQITNGEVNRIFTAKALDQGFNVDEMEFGLETSRSRNPTQRIQRTGRIARKFTYPDGTEKIGLYISLYIPDYIVKGSVDEAKLLEVSSGNEIWVDDEDEMIDLLKKYQFIKT